MDKLPLELVEAVLQACIGSGRKEDVLQLRLVCRSFDRILKKSALETIGMDFSSLSRRTLTRTPDVDSLQTVGYACKNLFIDLMVLRDEGEVDFLEYLYEKVPSMHAFCQNLHKKYTMHKGTFSDTDYFLAVANVLANCRGIEKLRLALPVRLIGVHCDAATRVLANTLKAFASRPEEDSADLKTLVLDNVSDVTLCKLWANPLDVMNIIKVVAGLDHLVISLLQLDGNLQFLSNYGNALWSVVESAQNLTSLCIIGMDLEDTAPSGLKQTNLWQMSPSTWRSKTLPARAGEWNQALKRLELRRCKLSAPTVRSLFEAFGPSLEELYLNEVYLKTCDDDGGPHNALWVGFPQVRPQEHYTWVAERIRCWSPRLRVCRAAFLGYDQFLSRGIAGHPVFDFLDPCGLGRSLAQRFVEVVTGVQQPNNPAGESIFYLPYSPKRDQLFEKVKPRGAGLLAATEYDTNAYQMAEGNNTSSWATSLDGMFENSNAGTLEELRLMADASVVGLIQIDSP